MTKIFDTIPKPVKINLEKAASSVAFQVIPTPMAPIAPAAPAAPVEPVPTPVAVVAAPPAPPAPSMAPVAVVKKPAKPTKPTIPVYSHDSKGKVTLPKSKITKVEIPVDLSITDFKVEQVNTDDYA